MSWLSSWGDGRRTLVRAALLATLGLSTAALAALGGCTQILGNDFVIVTEDDGAGGMGASGGAGGTGAAGGAGGSGAAGGGGQGGGPPGMFDCDWVQAEHTELLRLEGSTQYFSDSVDARRRDGQTARMVVGRAGGSSNEEVLVFTVGSGTPSMSAYPSDDLHQFDRVSIQALGLLYSLPAGNNMELRLRQIGDSSGGDDDLVASTASNAFPGLTSSANINARFAMVSSSIGDPVMDILAWWPVNGGYRLGFARYSGNPVAFTPVVSSVFTETEDVRITAMVHHDGSTYAWLGEDSSLGTRLITIPSPTSLPVNPVQVGLIDTFFFNSGSSATHTRFVGVRFTAPLQMLAGEVSNDGFAGFNPTDDLNVVGTWDATSDIPVLFARPRWHGRLSSFIGTPFPSNPDIAEKDLRYWFFDINGTERGFKILPFTATLPSGESRNGPVLGTSVPLGTDFDTAGGGLHVFWAEYHDSPSDQSFGVLYYDRLNCSLN